MTRINTAMQIFIEFLKNKDMKVTKERKAILREIITIPKHFEADDVLFSLMKKNEKVSRGSIYRTLPLLVESGILRKVIFTDKHQHYENTVEKQNHSHMICIKCGNIIEFRSEEIDNKLATILTQHNFEEKDHKIEVLGFCEECKNEVPNE